MNKLFITILIIAQSFIASSQIVQKRTYYYDRHTVESQFSFDLKTQQKHGAYAEYSPLGGVIVKGQYNQGKKVGKWQYWHTVTKELLTVENYNQKGLLDGDFLGVPDGHYDMTPSMGKYVNGNKEGVWKEFLTKNGELQITSISHWKNGNREGDYTEYYLDGKVKFKARYEQGEYNDNDMWGVLVDTALYYGEGPEPRLKKIEVYKYNRRIYSQDFKTSSDLFESKKDNLIKKYKYVADPTKPRPKSTRINYGGGSEGPTTYTDSDRLICINLLLGLASSDGVTNDEEKWLLDFVQHKYNDPMYYSDEVVKYIDVIKSKNYPPVDWKFNAETNIGSSGVFWDIARFLRDLAALDGTISPQEEAFIDKALTAKK